MNTAAQDFLDGFAEMRELQKLALLAQIEHQRVVRRRLVIVVVLGFAFLAVVLAALHSADAAVLTVAAELAIVLVVLLALGAKWLWRRINWREIGVTTLILAIACGVIWMKRNLPATPVADSKVSGQLEPTASTLPPGFVLDKPVSAPAVNSSNQSPAFGTAHGKGVTRTISTGCVVTFSSNMTEEAINKVVREMRSSDCRAGSTRRIVQFAGDIHSFPGDISDIEIATALSASWEEYARQSNPTR